jgi:polyisoprenoid-binding protein YceI
METTQARTGQQAWSFDPTHTLVEFAVKHMMFTTVKGRFGEVAGELLLDERQPERSKVTARIAAASIDTRTPQRDEHLRSADFLDAASHPELVFESTAVERVGVGRYRVRGDLTIRDVTREVELEVREEGRGRDPWGGDRIGFSASATLDRGAFGLTWNQALEAGGVLVGNEVRIALEVQAVRS